MVRLSRRAFVSGIAAIGASAAGLVLLDGCGLNLSQVPPKVPLIGFLSIGSAADVAGINAFRDGLREHGLVEGRDLVIEFRYADGQQDRLPALAAELVSLDVRLIVAGGPSMIAAARQVTDRVPIVMMGGPDPVAAGWAVSLARPAGNVTGTAVPGDQFFAKGIQLLVAVAPAARRLAFFMNLSIAGQDRLRDALATAAVQFGLQFLALDLRTDADIDPAFERARAWGMDAACISSLPPMNAQRDTVLAHIKGLPAISSQPFWVEKGLLMMLQISNRERGRRVAPYIARILQGADPADMPINLATEFELMVNTTTLANLGLTVPRDVATQVTEWVA
jgi:ABC-type uncharacterized transport system substrate-binding protein